MCSLLKCVCVQTTPLEAGLEFAVNYDTVAARATAAGMSSVRVQDFIGKQALLQHKDEGSAHPREIQLHDLGVGRSSQQQGRERRARRSGSHTVGRRTNCAVRILLCGLPTAEARLLQR